jgi:hypothetical protein
MNGKQAKKLRKLAALLTQSKQADTRQVYQRLKQVHKDNKKEI